MNRKEFVKTCGIVCLSGSVVAALLESCASTNYYAHSVLENNRITLKKTEFERIEKDKKALRNYVLVKTDKYNFPIYVCMINQDNYSALLMECTHRNCELKPAGDHLVCPCHGSEFTNKGAVQNPPAEQNLRSFITTTDDDYIYIQI